MRKILVLGMGGTISCAASEDGLKPAVSVDDLLKNVRLPGKNQIEIQTEQLFELDSTNMTPRHWETLAKRIHERYDEFDGFVITHGTDTMAYAASSLACLIQNSRKPIVLTGSMVPMSEEYEGISGNLCNAIIFAADERAFGVRIVFSREIIDGRAVTKESNQLPCPFLSLNEPGRFYPGGMFTFEEKYDGETRFYDKLSDDVFLAKFIPGQKLLLPDDVRVIIFESYGTGGIPDYYMSEIERLAKKGIYFIAATQCIWGNTDLQKYEVGRTAAKRFNMLESGKMNVEYTVARARWALEYSNSFEEFGSLFIDKEFF